MASSFEDLTQRVSGRFNEKIKGNCRQLFQHFNLIGFFYFEIKTSGSFAFFNTDLPWLEYYGAKKSYFNDPYFRNPKYFEDGVVLLKDTRDEELLKILGPARENFNIGLILKLMQKSSDGLEVFGFSSNSSDENQISSLLSELPLLRLFTKKFREENSDLFLHLEKNQIDLVDLLGSSIYEKRSPVMAQPRANQAFLERIGIRIEKNLSSKEAEVIKLLLLGYSASQVALQLHLSSRTVEHYIERIKEKLGCFSKSELIQKSRQLELLDCL